MNDRERLIDILYEGFYISPGNDIKGTAQKAADYLIANGVTVQKHGRWIECEDSLMDVYYECSVCGEAFFLDEGTPDENCYKFCPNCGAKMDGEANGT